MIVAACALLALCYWAGGRRPVRLIPPSRRWGSRQWRTASFSAGLLVTAFILSDPIDGWVRDRFWLRTAQLVMLAMLIAPLIVLGAPSPRFARLLGQSRTGRPSKATALVAFVLFNGALILAYLPSVYAATGSPGALRQLSFLLFAALAAFFWSQVIAQPPRRCGLNHVERVAYLVLSSVLIRGVGLVLGFAPAPFYRVPLIDQQFGAGVLLVPGVFTDLIVLTVCLYLWLGQDARRQSERFDTGGRVLPAVRERPLTTVSSRY
jgi:cytochrome c oxidase assembly factor CtaG